MAIDETELPTGAPNGQHSDARGTDALSGFAAEDFRLRLDSPLFHRDPGMGAASAPQLRELTWEHVVRPMHPATDIDNDTIDNDTIEALLEQLRDDEEPLAVVAQFQPVPPLAVLELPVFEASAPDAVVPDAVVPDVVVPDVELAAVDVPVAEVVPVLPAAKPRVESLFAALEQMDQVPVDPPVEYLTRPISEQIPVVAVSTAPTAPAVSGIEAELNRLAFVPDVDEVPGPVVVPAIAYSEQRESSAVPILSQHDLYKARNAAPVSPGRLNHVDVSTTFIPVARKKKRNVFARLATFLVFIALLGGAAYAGKYYFLDKRWEGDIKVLANDVETARGLSFDHALAVNTLPVTDYASKLVSSSLAPSTDEMALEAGMWRAVGILDGALNLGQIGMAALPNSPAFYDPASDTIFVAEGLPDELYRFAMHRALTLALLDQKFDWSARAQDASPSVARGIKGYYDGDAIAVALGMTTPTEQADIFKQTLGLFVDYSIAASPSPFASTVASRLGVALWPYFDATIDEDRAMQEKDAAPSDGQLLDLRRLTSGAAESTSKTSQGMLFWYHALAGRIDENTAWEAALAWQNDDVSIVEGPTGACVTAHLQVNPASLDSVNVAFQAWAAAAPPTSGTSVALTTNGSPMQLQINACDPGPGLSTTSGVGYLGLGGAPLRAEQLRLLLEAQPTLPPAQAACAVFGGDAVSIADERGVIDDAPGWSAPASHPLPDPNRLGCAPV